MFTSLLAVIGGLVVLTWSADRFVDGASGTARHFDLPPLLIGMLIVGFGTSAPEIVVSSLAAWQGNPGLGLGNAFGSNITNIALILGLTALLKPLSIHSQIINRELPILIAVTALVAGLAYVGNYYSRLDGLWLLIAFTGLMGWSIRAALTGRGDALAGGAEAHALPEKSLGNNVFWLALGLVLLVASSRLLVWGAVDIAQQLGVSDLVIGLTIVAIGTSLPELASSIAAVRKNEHDLAVGNVIGSNLFNSLIVVGLAVTITPTDAPPELLTRDLPIMSIFTVGLFLMAYGITGHAGRVSRVDGGLLLAGYIGYTGWLVLTNV